MALGFGRKKAADSAAATPVSSPVVSSPTEAAPVPAHAPSSPPNDDIDAFDLDAFTEAPSLHTGAPATVNPSLVTAPPATTDSAFDFPAVPDTPTASSESVQIGTAQIGTARVGASQIGVSPADPPDFDKGYAIEQANAARTGHTAAPAPFVPPTATIGEPATPFYEPQTIEPTVVAAPKKKFPLVPALGALAILGLGSGVAYMMSQGQPAEEATPAVAASRPARAETAVEARAVEAGAVEADAKPVAPTKVQAAPLDVVPVKPVPVKPGAGTVTKVPKIVTITNSSPVRPGIAPASDQMSQLKTLWNQGANAKHRGETAAKRRDPSTARREYAAARRYWRQGLKIQPTNIGFQESIAKLPK